MNSEAKRKAFILTEIQKILGSIPDLKHTLLSLKEGYIEDHEGLRIGTGTGYDFTLKENQMKSAYPINENLRITYYVPEDMTSDISTFNKYISDQGGDTYKIAGTFGPYMNYEAYILINNKASKNSIRITVRGGGRRRKHTKKAHKSRRGRSRKHRS